MIICPNCGAKLKYDVAEKKIKCEYCGSLLDPANQNLQVSVAVEQVDAKNYICQSCGAELLTFDETAATFCNYCGSENMLEDRLIKINKPDFVIPFKITKEESIKIYKKKVEKNLLIPKYMKSNIVLEKIHGIYMPYAIYKFNHRGITKNKGSKYWKRRGDYDYYKDYDILADITVDIEGISYDLVSNFYDQYSFGISPYDYNEAIPFNLNYISGFYADKKDIKNKTYISDAKKIANEYVRDELNKKREFHKYGCTDPVVYLKEDEVQIGMFPVYFLAFRNQKKNTISYAVINGQTGKIAADMPIDFFKYMILSFLLSIFIYCSVHMVLYINFKKLLMLGSVMSIFTLIISAYNIHKINRRKLFKDDKGMKSIKKEQNKDINAFKYIIKQLIGIGLVILLMIINPVNDIYYYLGTIILSCLNILSFNDIVKEHNMLTTRNIPQLEKRGGDKNA